jgi:hypothetical protein
MMADPAHRDSWQETGLWKFGRISTGKPAFRLQSSINPNAFMGIK